MGTIGGSVGQGGWGKVTKALVRAAAMMPVGAHTIAQGLLVGHRQWEQS